MYFISFKMLPWLFFILRCEFYVTILKNLRINLKIDQPKKNQKLFCSQDGTGLKKDVSTWKSRLNDFKRY